MLGRVIMLPLLFTTLPDLEENLQTNISGWLWKNTRYFLAGFGKIDLH
jgi:hypothetical protein